MGWIPVNGKPMDLRLTKLDAFSGVTLLRLMAKMPEEGAVTDPAGSILPCPANRPGGRGRLVEYRLGLLVGEWWENTGMGFSILEVMRTSRITEDSGSALASMISAYIRETPGVQEVEDVRFSVSGRRFSYSCLVRNGQGTASVSYDFS